MPDSMMFRHPSRYLHWKARDSNPFWVGRRAILASLILACLSTEVVGAEFRAIGDDLADFNGQVKEELISHLSDDGTVATGWTYPENRAESWTTRWTIANEPELLGRLPLADVDVNSWAAETFVHYSGPTFVSADGQVIAGTTWAGIRLSPQSGPLHLSRGFRWTRETGMQPLEMLDGFERQLMYEMSADGSVIVGSALDVFPASSTTLQVPVRWTIDGDIQELPLPDGFASGFAAGVSGDGSMVVGTINEQVGGLGRENGFRWTAQEGMVLLPSSERNSRAAAVSEDGSVIAGRTYVPDPDGGREIDSRATRWSKDDGRFELTGFSPLTTASFSSHVSHDGSLIFGYYIQEGDYSDLKPFVWDEVHEVRHIEDVLANEHGLGAAMAGWNLEVVEMISRNKQMLVGTGRNSQGEPDKWIAYLDTPLGLQPRTGDFNNDGTVDAADYIVWRNGLGTNYTPADYAMWRANFGATAAGAAAAVNISHVPEPTSALLLLVGFAVPYTLRCRLQRC